MTTVELHFFENKNLLFSEPQKSFLNEISKKIQLQINSDEFRTKVLNFKYKKGRHYHQDFKLNKGKTRNQIFDIFMSGKDPYDDTDKVLNIHIKPYIKKIKVHATTYKNVRSVFLNTLYLDYCMKNTKTGNSKMAGTLIHEYIHIMGFSHYTNKAKKKDMPTVPWGIGNIIKKLIAG